MLCMESALFRALMSSNSGVGVPKQSLLCGLELLLRLLRG